MIKSGDVDGVVGALIILAITCAVCFAVQEAQTVQWGSWRLTFDSQTGDLLSLVWNGQTIAQAPPSGSLASLDIAVGERLEKRRWLIERGLSRSRLVERHFEARSGLLTLTREVSANGGRWQLQEQVQFGAFGNPNRIARSVRLTWLGSQPAKFYRIRFILPLPKKGTFLFPTKDPFDATHSGDLALCPQNYRASSAWGVGQFLLQQSKDLTLLFINDARRDPAVTHLWAVDDAVFVIHEFVAMGWAEPNEPQTVGSAFLEVVPEPLPKALRTAFWQWYDDVGIKVPADRPKWVNEVALYSFHPGGTIGSNFLDLGGFAMAKRHLLPIIRWLGFSAIWLLPIEDRGVYNPRDYYRFQEGLGTEEEYRQLVDEAHRLGMKVWQDIVPHGGTPEHGKVRGNKPWWLVFDEDGNALNYWCFDFREPDWQRYIGQVAEHYVKTFGIDGFRVDAVGGSRMMNWRRKGFPPAEKVPDNVPADWWQKGLAEAGGQVPMLPYERGSLTLREGGLQMLRVIRQATKRFNPDGAILGEVEPVPYMQEADVIYDFTLCHRHLMRLREVSPAEFVFALQRYFEEQRFAEPKGTVRLRYAESHDSLRAQYWLGVSAVRAFMALTFWVEGMPMLYHEAEIGHGVFIQRALSIRNALPELQTGDALYTDADHSSPLVKTNPDGIFTCLRTKDYVRASVPVINFNPNPVTAIIHLPIELLKLKENDRYAIWEGMTGAKLVEGKPKEIAKVKLTLSGYQSALLILRPAEEGCPVTQPIVEPKIARRQPSLPKLKKLEDKWEVTTRHYRLTIDAKTGMIRHFANADGKVLINGSELVTEEPATVKQVIGSPTQGKEEIIFPMRIILSDGTQVQLTYRCLPTEVKLQGALRDETTDTEQRTSGTGQGAQESGRIGLLFAIADVYRWQVNTVEGLLDDWFFVRHLSGKRGTHGIYWRPQGTEILWQSEMTPLHPDNAWLCFWQRGGIGFRLAFDEPLKMGVDNVLLLDKVWDGDEAKVGAYVAIMWRDRTSFVPQNKLPRSFSLSLSIPPDVSRPLSTTLPSITLSHTGTDWVIENAHYRVLLRRTGGTIRALWAKQPKERLIFTDSDIYTDKGFRNVQWQVQYAGAKDDVEAGARVWLDGSVLRMRFFGTLRAGNERFRMLRPPVWFVQDYAFDSSPVFTYRFAVMSEGNVQVPPAFLAWVVVVPQAQKFAYIRQGEKLGEWICDEKQRAGETAKIGVLPEAIFMSDDSGNILASFLELRFNSPSLPRNIFMHGKRFFIAWLDGDKEIAPRKWHEATMSVAIGSLPKVKAISIEPLKADTEGIVDPSFERMGAEVFAVTQGRWLRFGASKETGWLIPAGGSITTEIARTGKRCAKVVNTTGAYTLFTQPLSLAQFPPKSKVILSAWLKGENIQRGDQGWKAATLDLSIQHKDGRWEHKAVAFLDGSFDWRKVEGVVEIPEDAVALMLRVGLNGATGTLWIDDVSVELLQ